MAAILCRVCFVEPCKACSRCCEGMCKCLGSCCEAFQNCCDSITSLCDKPFSGCLIVSILINFVAFLYGIISIASGASDCGDPLVVLLVIMFICSLVNVIFSCYMYRTVNGDENNPLFDKDNDLSTGGRLWAFFKYDVGMAIYILFVLGMIALCIAAMVIGGSCDSTLGSGTLAMAIILLVYLGVSLLILFSYTAFDAFKEMAKNCCWWWLPFCWPCLCIGVCLNCADGLQGGDDAQGRQQNSKRPVRATKNPHPHKANNTAPQNANKQVYAVAQPQPIVQYKGMVSQPAQQQTYVAPPPQQYQAQPGVLVVGGNPNQQPASGQAPGVQVYISDDIKNAAKSATTSALGWMAKKAVQYNDKVEQQKAAQAAPQEGTGYNNTNNKQY